MTAVAAIVSLLALAAAASLALYLRCHAHILLERQLVDMMFGMLAALAIATAIPALRWYVTAFQHNQGSLAFVWYMGPVTAATSCLQLIIIASWILYRRTLLIESEQRRREREKPREWLSPPRQTRDESANQISRMPLFSTPRGAMHATPQVTPAVKTGKSLDLKLKEIKKKLKIPEEEDEAITAEVLADMVPIDGTVDQKISELHEKLMSTCLVPPAHPRSCAHSVHMCMIPTTALSSCTSCPHAPILFSSPAIAHASVPPPVPTLG